MTYHLRDMTGVNMLADIGNGTVNIMYITNLKPISAKSHTEKMDVNQKYVPSNVREFIELTAAKKPPRKAKNAAPAESKNQSEQ